MSYAPVQRTSSSIGSENRSMAPQNPPASREENVITQVAKQNMPEVDKDVQIDMLQKKVAFLEKKLEEKNYMLMGFVAIVDVAANAGAYGLVGTAVPYICGASGVAIALIGTLSAL